MADMEIFNDLHNPEIGILCCGGHFTMDMKRAAYATEKGFQFQNTHSMSLQNFPTFRANCYGSQKKFARSKYYRGEVLNTFSV